MTGDGQARFLDTASGLLLGSGFPARRTEAVEPLPPGSTLLLYTDGLIESPAQGIDPGLSQLRRHAAALAHRPLDRMCDQLLDRVRPGDNQDDVALLAIRTP
ncbi:PP2C family protein-serine/threonine phosphatase [Streptacidiphilus monticola]